MSTITQRIASAFVVLCGRYGDVTKMAHDREQSRQSLYREASQVANAVDGTAFQSRIDELQRQLAGQQAQIQDLQERLEHAIEITRDKQDEFASVAQAEGVSLSVARRLLQVVAGSVTTPSVPTLGRATEEAGQRAGQLLEVIDEVAQPKVKQATADEIFGSSCVSGGYSKMHERRGIIPSLEPGFDLADGFSLTRMVCARMLNILNLIDDARCFETVRAMRWPQGVTCPHCDSPQVTKQGHDESQPARQKYECTVCRKRFDDLTGTIFAGHHQPLRVWMLCLYFMGLNLSNEQIAQELDLNSDDAQKMTTQLREGIIERKPKVTLSGEVECDEVYVVAGHKGKPEEVKKKSGPGAAVG